MNERKTTAQDFFLNLGVTVTLYAVIVAFLNLVFDIVNWFFPDNLNYYYDVYSYGTRLAIATLVIVFPLFVWLSRIVTRIIASEPERKDAAVRRWLVYITLFLASAALVVDLVALLNTFLSGEITVRFSLKVLAVLVVAGIVFWHYLGVVRNRSSERRLKATLIVATVLIIAGIITALASFGLPQTVRKMRFDDTRSSNLQNIQWQIVNYWQQKGALPDSLDALANPISGFALPTDPETGAAYGYSKTGLKTFKLCADFDLASRPAVSKGGNTELMRPDIDNWRHASGTVCFDRSIDADLYPVRSK